VPVGARYDPYRRTATLVDNVADKIVDILGDDRPVTDSGPTAVPTTRARELVRGAFDLHVHVDPDVIERIVDDVTLAQRFRKLGLAGFALKSHYAPTAERARVVNRVVEGVEVIGTITLNASVGGLNALAVEVAAREGARIVWLPTVDSVNEASERDRPYPPGAKIPMWVRLQRELREQGLEASPVPVVDGSGVALDALRAVLAVAARHDLILATGHLSRDEIFVVVDAALAAGVTRVVVTHPEFTSQRIPIKDQVTLAHRGAVLERCFTTAHTGKCSWEEMFDGIRATGLEHNLLSTDLGQPGNPQVEDGLALFADRLLEAGFSEQAIETMIVHNSRVIASVARPRAGDAWGAR
jgi:hypothetical protein